MEAEKIERLRADLSDLNLLFWHLVRREAERNVRDMRGAAAEYRMSARLLQRVTRLSDSALPALAQGPFLHFELNDPQLLYDALTDVHEGRPSKKPPVDNTLKCHLLRRFLILAREAGDRLEEASILFRIPIGLAEVINLSSLKQLERVIVLDGLGFMAIDTPALCILAEAAELGDTQGWADATRIALGTVFDPDILATV